MIHFIILDDIGQQEICWLTVRKVLVELKHEFRDYIDLYEDLIQLPVN